MSDATPGPAEATAEPAPANPIDSRGRTFPCDGCGAELVFHIGAQSLKCPYCGHVKPIELAPQDEIAEQDFAAMIARLAELREAGRQDETGLREVACAACGGTVRFAGNLTSSECAYCGVPLQLDRVHDAEHRVPVDGVLPFLVERGQAHANLASWVGSRWFAPNDFLKRGAQGRFNGLYTPYWTYDSLTATNWSGMRGDHYWVTVGSGKSRRRVQRTRWSPRSGSFQQFFDDVLVVAAAGLPDKVVRKLEPWPLDRCVPYEPRLIAGFLSRTYDAALDQGFVEARQRIDAALRVEVKRRIGGDVQRITSMQTAYNAVTFKHLLLPLWMLTYRFKEKAYQVLVNAATGEVQGNRPYSWIKIALAAVVAAIVGGTAFYLGNR